MTVSVKKIRGIWHYRFQVKPFKRIQRSTRERNERRARKIAQQAYDEAVSRSNGGKPVPTLAALAADWLAVRSPVVSRSHAKSVERFARLHLYDLGELPIDQLHTKRVELARNVHLLTHKPASTNHWLRILKLIVKWAVNDKVLPVLPWKVPEIDIQKQPRAMLPLAATTRWFAAIDAATARPVAQHVATAIRMMYGLGLREMEAAGARWEWIDWERQTYTPGQTKGKEADPIPLPDWLLAHLAPLRRDTGLIAPRTNGRQRPPGFTTTAMRKANAACQIARLTPHRLRGSFATLLSESGASIQEVQAALRHKDPLTTMAYLERQSGVLVQAQRRIARRSGMDGQQSGNNHPGEAHE